MEKAWARRAIRSALKRDVNGAVARNPLRGDAEAATDSQGEHMSDKERQKKDGERQDKKKQAMRDAERDPKEKAERSQQKGKQSGASSGSR
jgi:hypothetical protein